MATKYECDRCGEQTSTSKEIGKVEYPIVSRMNSYHESLDNIGSKDLCKSCLTQLNAFLAPQAKPKTT